MSAKGQATLRQAIIDQAERDGGEIGEPTDTTYELIDSFNALFPDHAISEKEAGGNR